MNLLLVEDNLPDELMVREAIKEQELPCDIHAVADGVRAIEFLVKSETDCYSVRESLLGLGEVADFSVSVSLT